MKRYIKSAVADISSEDPLAIHDMLNDKVTSDEILRQLAEISWDDDHLWIPQLIAAHPNAEADTLRTLYWNYADKFVRVYLASNVKTPQDILRNLAMDSWKEIRIDVAKNPNTPEDVLERLSQDGHCGYAIVRNPNLPRRLVEKMANSRDSDLRYYVASVETTPLDILEKLTNDSDFDVVTRAKSTLRKIHRGEGVEGI